MRAWASRKLIAALAALALAGPLQAQTSDLVSRSDFRVCADPAAWPASSEDRGGYEIEIAKLLAEKLERPVSFEWYPMATGFIRNTLAANRCDVVMGYAQGHEMVLNTNHYLTSVYTLVVPKSGPLADVTSLSDDALKDARIGVIAGSPPGNHMARAGLMGKARPYALMVDRRYDNPQEAMLADLAAGEIDAAVLWGPIAGPMVKSDYPDLTVIPLVGETAAPKLFYRITMGVRRAEKVWQRQLNSLIRRNQDEINRILSEAGVPLTNDMGTELLDVSG